MKIDNDIAMIIIVTGIGLIIFLLIILILVKAGILGNRTSKCHGKAMIVKDGMGINGYDISFADKGLNGFGEDKSGTLLIGVSRKLAETKHIFLTSQTTGIQYGCSMMDCMGIGRQNTDYQYQTFLQITEDGSISKLHAEFFRYNGEIYLQDLKSSNHTRLNGQIIQEPVRVKSGDYIQLGNVEFVINIKEQ